MPEKDVCKLGDCIVNIISRIAYMFIYAVCAVFFVSSAKCILEMESLGIKVFCVLVILAFVFCSIRFLEELLFIPVIAYCKRRNTFAISKTFTGLSYEKKIHLLIEENYCPVIEKACLEREGQMSLNGYYSTHTLFFEGDKVTITSEKHDSKADIEANKIMKFIVASM